MPSKDYKSKCCKKYKKKGKYCKRCPLRAASLPSIDREKVKEELREAQQSSDTDSKSA